MAVSHFLGPRARKAPVLAPGAGNPDEVAITVREPSAGQRRVAEQALAAVPVGGRLLYARVDLLPGGDGRLADAVLRRAAG